MPFGPQPLPAKYLTLTAAHNTLFSRALLRPEAKINRHMPGAQGHKSRIPYMMFVSAVAVVKRSKRMRGNVLSNTPLERMRRRALHVRFRR